MTGFAVDTKQLAAVSDRLAATGDRFTDGTGTLTGQAADVVAQLAGPRTPRRTGTLAASLSVSDTGFVGGSDTPYS